MGLSDRELARTPLYDRHIALGARMIEFGGWLMPVEYSGILTEHRNVRDKAGLFDLCHMGELAVRDAAPQDPSSTAETGRLQAATGFLDWVLTRGIRSMAEGDVVYSPMCRWDGGIVDDVVVYRRAGDYLLVVNAATTAKDLAWLQELARQWTDQGHPPVEITDLSRDIALLAVQGPAAEAILQPLVACDLSRLRFYQSVQTTVAGFDALLSRTGYTGEDGFEIYFKAEHAGALWDRLLEAGRPHGLVPVGLGARDTLRLEARLLLYGNDIDETTHPLEAGLQWAIDWDKPDFVGKEALLRLRQEGPKRRLVAFEMVERGIPRHGYPIWAADGTTGPGSTGLGDDSVESTPRTPAPIGHVTSGSHSPSLNRPIGLGYVAVEYARPGTVIAIDIRGQRRQARVVKGRFVESRTKR